MGKLIDIDGNEYQAVQIGNQIWMEENLRVKHFRDGSPILHAPSNEEWLKATGKREVKGLRHILPRIDESETIPAWCSYENKDENEQKYGLLYNYSVINQESNIAPEGWRVPKQDDFQEMFNFLEGEPEPYGFSRLSGKLKAKNEWWNNPFHNESGFSALPSGSRLCKVRPSIMQLDIDNYKKRIKESETFDSIIEFKGLKENCTFWTASYHRGPIIIFLKNEKDEERDFVLIDYTENHHSGESIRLIKENAFINI
jgi:uncharacterized protein (TIGR02145 family)